MKDRNLRPATRAAQALGWECPETGAVVPPIHVSTTFARDVDYELPTGADYARDKNPSFNQPEAVIADLEGGADALLFASGMAACVAPFQALRQGDHVVAPDIMYYGLPKWLRGFGMDRGLSVDFVSTADMDALAAAVRPDETKLVWVESPCNPVWRVTDLAKAAEIAHGAGAQLAVDSTAATPVLTRPFEHGADIVVHAATKYLNGHSDVMAGAVVAKSQDAYWERIAEHRALTGPILGSFEAFLLTRGMRTLFLRVKAASQSALAIAECFEEHPALTQVQYPGLLDHPDHEVAQRQMEGGFGGMLSFRVKGDADTARRVAASCNLFKPATSLGGVESLIEHRGTVEGPDSLTPKDLLRLSVGIEDTGDLIADLEQALTAA
ncbi:MAG: aminotransferase class I/II-fold pyridoxal phosphate-dependent enzyme [Alphaproteobacteria bacterium]|nr:aminotransferase class I/II-fold pyridoxal phosphate-dependent enzyme [Alphaproteobacteria bacterium]